MIRYFLYLWATIVLFFGCLFLHELWQEYNAMAKLKPVPVLHINGEYVTIVTDAGEITLIDKEPEIEFGKKDVDK